ncbi:hypothetical protein [Synechococcus sp. CBW1004]|uniref:hypothetical protein n=1 Tax=Synechococcus sp. CBW1004 TaxID=1353136 RepID=UPI0018CC8BD3|nr:hypothetical protein [Synechococcus sp. CBW1004]QPN62795.1 hypothetical protein H8F25_14260 [Synechococcus sp. CBW1004]
MNKLIKPALSLAVAATLFCGHAEAQSAIKGELQALARKEILRISSKGQLTFVDLSDSSIKKIVPTDNHPEIFSNSSGTLFVLCITGTDKRGGKVPIDIYISKEGGALRLVDINFGDQARKGFMGLEKKGVVRRL